VVLLGREPLLPFLVRALNLVHTGEITRRPGSDRDLVHRLATRRGPEATATACEKLIAAELGLEIPAVVRTRDELAEVVRRNPFAGVADDPKRYQVSFLDGEPDPKVIEKLSATAADGERIEAIGREIYAWHPAGIARSKMWAALAGKGLGVKATARNWTTVTTLLEMAEE